MLRDEGALDPEGRDARAIYAQTDSVFVLFPHATSAQAVALGEKVRPTHQLVMSQHAVQ